MNDREQHRLAELQKENRWGQEKLSRSDLLLLLKADLEVQECIRHLVTYEETAELAEMEVASPTPLPPLERCQEFVEPTKYIAPSPPRKDGLHAALAPELELLAWIARDRELEQAWLGTEDDGERRVVRLIAVAAQWDRLLLLWDRLAFRCKEEARPASPVEQQILSRCLALHNLIWQGRQASLQVALPGESFDPLRHERGVLHGDRVSSVWLPGLHNAAGQLQRKPLVGT